MVLLEQLALPIDRVVVVLQLLFDGRLAARWKPGDQPERAARPWRQPQAGAGAALYGRDHEEVSGPWELEQARPTREPDDR
ncbi:hypothetical protein [Streptomyces sp. SID8352]|uniref:hypothetical protein n=1 Tax=Streptomyces sp. SID8352 TaxID=2690338 RepID=UPI00136A5D21|nr:hypothetical protein [Streptomyces sp. SID8352]MYU26206.1 hypothetical protein [Streptomyces sp. SID8352]